MKGKSIRLARKLREQRGVVTVTLLLVFTVLMGAAAMAVDLGMGFRTKEKLQNAADSAALEAARNLIKGEDAAREAALEMAELNGADREQVTVNFRYQGDDDLVQVICAKPARYLFAGMIGVEDGMISAGAVAEATPMGGPFRYTIFSGSEKEKLEIYGGEPRVTGGIHSNAGLIITSKLNVEGDVEAVKALELYVSSGSTVSGKIQGASLAVDQTNVTAGQLIRKSAEVVDMPDFTESIIAAAKASGTFVQGSQQIGMTGHSYQLKEASGSAGQYSWQMANHQEPGKKLYMLIGNDIVIDAPIFVDGNLMVSCSSFTGNGFIIATGTIMLYTGGVRTTGSSVGFYSREGDVIISTSKVNFGGGIASSGGAVSEGLIYAPNGGIKFYMDGIDGTFRGRLVAQTIDFSGSTLNISSTPGDLDCLPKTQARLIR